MRLYVNSKRVALIFAALLFSLAFTMSPLHRQAKAVDKKLDFKESRYNNIFVYKRGPYIAMTFGHNKRFFTETIYDTRDEKALPVTYTRYMTVSLAYSGKTENILEIGFGGGRTTKYLHEHLGKNTAITSVELDPAVVEFAKKYFGIESKKNFKIVVADGRRYLAKTPDKKWDVIMIDAYRGPFVPFHLLTKEFFQKVKDKLSNGGIAVQNIEPSTMMFDSAISTIASVFDHIDLFEADGNVVAVAYSGKQKSQEELLKHAQNIQNKYDFKYNLGNMLKSRRVVINKKIKGKILTDDFAPVESLLAIQRHNKKLDGLSEKAVK
ncbi:MAG: spermidine synthase [Methyloligellaceae bacterium]